MEAGGPARLGVCTKDVCEAKKRGERRHPESNEQEGGTRRNKLGLPDTAPDFRLDAC